jgi:hypothetical protein
VLPISGTAPTTAIRGIARSRHTHHRVIARHRVIAGLSAPLGNTVPSREMLDMASDLMLDMIHTGFVCAQDQGSRLALVELSICKKPGKWLSP